MKTFFFTFILFLLSCSSFAQYITTLKNEDGYLKNADGSLIQKQTSFVEEGSKSLPEKNCLAILRTKDGKVYNNVTGHIDLQTEGFIYTVKDQEFMCVLPIEQITFDSCEYVSGHAIFKAGYPSVDKQTAKSLYQVLSQGKASLLKHYEVKWQDLTPFNSTNTTRIYTQMQQYYLFFNGKMFKLEKNKDNLQSILGTSKEYITKNNLNLKKEEDAVKLINYYNSL